MSPQELQRLAQACRPQHRRFAQARVADPLHEQMAAAKVAGSRSPKFQGSRWAARPEVAAYYHALMVVADEEILAHRSATLAAGGATAVASLEESLATATTVMRGRLGDHIHEDGTVDIAAIRGAPAGVMKSYQVETEVRSIPGMEGAFRTVEKVKFAMGDQLSAARTMVAHYDKLEEIKRPANVANILVQVLQSHGIEAARDVARETTVKVLRGEE